ncbi:hypothetical protein [Cellulosilyticum lentocellum]|uniref:Uncharacterized protein n=1 Tax=Cellulosilyticum lentocellum (strain ATCC 49066 / DSM 5427 / NCIMB 11756 / RHM5) TaxID=642492 RepID=F2JJT7_CELLD|nr:hypothetical protein [Cellulosilyticum lentocellum]ADZ83219.1 hypothetical protein Clole_1493 [Cellulosilyticum lentocellum DSM 5427]
MNKLRTNYTFTLSIIILIMVSMPLFANTHTEREVPKKVIKIYKDFNLLKEQGDTIKINMLNYTLDYIERIDNTNNYKVVYVLQEKIIKTFDSLDAVKEFGDSFQLNELQYNLFSIKRIGETEKMIVIYVLKQ